MPRVRALPASPDVGSINPGDAKGSCDGGRGDVHEHRLNLLYENLGSQPIRKGGRVPCRNAAAWRRRDWDASAFALTLCAATVPAVFAASRICSLWNVGVHVPQYFRSGRMDVPQILQ